VFNAIGNREQRDFQSRFEGGIEDFGHNPDTHAAPPPVPGAVGGADGAPAAGGAAWPTVRCCSIQSSRSDNFQAVQRSESLIGAG
jgi:hypothetical protein